MPFSIPSVTCYDAADEKLARTKVKEWRGRKVVKTLKTWVPQWNSPYVDDVDSIKTWEMFADWDTTAPTLSLSTEPEPVNVERALPLREDTPKSGLDGTLELITRILTASEEDRDLSALSLKNKL